MRGVICICHSASVQRLSFLFERHSVPSHANLEHLQVRSLTFPGPASYRSVFRRRDPWAQPPFSMLIAIPHRHLIRLKVGRRRETYRPTDLQCSRYTHPRTARCGLLLGRWQALQPYAKCADFLHWLAPQAAKITSPARTICETPRKDPFEIIPSCTLASRLADLRLCGECRSARVMAYTRQWRSTCQRRQTHMHHSKSPCQSHLLFSASETKY